MTRLKSNWKLTHDPTGTPVVILDYGDWLADELEIDLRRLAEVIELAESVEPHLRDRGNVSGSLRFTLVAEEEGDTADADARAASLDALLDAMARGKAPLRLDALGKEDAYYLFSQAICISSAPAMLRHPALARWQQRVEITVAGMSKIPIPPPEDP